MCSPLPRRGQASECTVDPTSTFSHVTLLHWLIHQLFTDCVSLTRGVPSSRGQSRAVHVSLASPGARGLQAGAGGGWGREIQRGGRGGRHFSRPLARGLLDCHQVYTYKHFQNECRTTLYMHTYSPLPSLSLLPLLFLTVSPLPSPYHLWFLFSFSLPPSLSPQFIFRGERACPSTVGFIRRVHPDVGPTYRGGHTPHRDAG